MQQNSLNALRSSVFLSFLLILSAGDPLFGYGYAKIEIQTPVGDETFSEDIHTILIRSSTWELSSPVVELGSEQRLELLFDDLSGIARNYAYSFVHCDASWNKSDLQPQEYLSGIGQGTISESSSSINTSYGFIHYRLEFPQEECMPVLSGNYALEVFDADNPDRIVFTRKFYVIEKKMQLTGKVRQALPGEFRETGQQVEFSVKYDNFPIADPVRDLVVMIRQNGRNDRILNNLKPSYSAQGTIEYADPEEGIFPGGNEFRTLDIKSMKYQTENTAGIDFQNQHYHVFLKHDKNRDNSSYFTKTDLNGNFFINQEKSREKHLEADYVYVHFFLDQAIPLQDDVYVFGKFSDWACTKENRMKYNVAGNCYEAVILLKQGLYDYEFVTLDKTTGKPDDEIFEGSYYETGNDYEIYVYLHDNRSRYDRLIGYLPLKT